MMRQRNIHSLIAILLLSFSKIIAETNSFSLLAIQQYHDNHLLSSSITSSGEGKRRYSTSIKTKEATTISISKTKSSSQKIPGFFRCQKIPQSHLFSSASSSSSSSSSPSVNGTVQKKKQQQQPNQKNKPKNITTKKYKHVLAILAMPYTSVDRIANEIILENVLRVANKKVSIVLRCENSIVPSVAELRRYVGEIYSQLWDSTMQLDAGETYNTLGIADNLPDIVVYPQNLPNLPPESWIDIQPDLDCICSHDFITGWTSAVSRSTSSSSSSTSSSSSKAESYIKRDGAGFGGLKEHVSAVNVERQIRNLKQVDAMPVEGFFYHPATLSEQDADHVTFLDDDDYRTTTKSKTDSNDDDDDDDDNYYGSTNSKNINYSPLLSGPARNSNSNNNQLFYSVAVGGTFDGMHYGHRKLLTLAVSSVHPITGRLLVGVTIDDMLKHKSYAELIPTFEQRCEGVKQFLYRLAPGMINRIVIKPISDSFGPPGQVNENNKYHFDALVLSHETLPTGIQLNEHRIANDMPPLQLLCTRRTEAHGMSSTALRKIRKEQQTKE